MLSVQIIWKWTESSKNRKTTINDLCSLAANFMSVTKDFWETIPIFHLFIPFQFWPSTRHQVRQLHKENIRQHTKTLQIVPPYQTRINKTHLSLKSTKCIFLFSEVIIIVCWTSARWVRKVHFNFYGCGKDNIDLLVCYWDGHLVVQTLWTFSWFCFCHINVQLSSGSRNWVYESMKHIRPLSAVIFSLSLYLFTRTKGMGTILIWCLPINDCRLHALCAM